MRLDDFLPAYDFAEVHSVLVRAPAARVFQELIKVTPDDAPLFRFLLAARALPSKMLAGQSFRMQRRASILDQFLLGGFVLLAQDTARELVVGRIAQFWKLRGGSAAVLRHPGEFIDFDQPGYAKAALNFWLTSEGDHTRVRTETRIRATDEASRRRFFRYWLLIRVGSGLIRRSWLRAIKRKAERQA
jgi:hypothetical protein